MKLKARTIVPALLAGLLLLAGGLLARGWRRGGKAALLEVTLTPETVHIGDRIAVVATVRLPWRQRVAGAPQVELPEGLQLLATPAPHLAGIGWGVWRWRAPLELQAFSLETFAGLEGRIPLTPGAAADDSLAFAIPDIEVTPRLDADDEGQLAVAPELPQSFLQDRGWRRWLWVGLAALVLIALAAFFLIRAAIRAARARGGEYQPPPPKPRDVAQKALFRLEDRLPLEPNVFFVELTDIVRRYIEAACELPATEQTTPEFLREIDRDDSPLRAAHRLLLADFLSAADMVKFARQEATVAQMEDALKKAKGLVTETADQWARDAAAATAGGPAA